VKNVRNAAQPDKLEVNFTCSDSRGFDKQQQWWPSNARYV